MRLNGYGYLVDRNEQAMTYFGGGPADGTGCSCGITNTCSGGKKCNCDSNREEWLFDEGYVTEKRRLPLTGVTLGDTNGRIEEGAHTIGPLLCEE
eukprot:gene7005-biopygen8431